MQTYWKIERYGEIKFFHPGVILTTSPLTDKPIATIKAMPPVKGQLLSAGIDGKTLTVVQTYTPESSKPFETINIEDFQKQYLSDIKEEDLWEQFKKDLFKEVIERKISKIKYYRIINKLTQQGLAEKLNTKQPNIARIEKVGYNVDREILKKLGNIFNIDYKEFLE